MGIPILSEIWDGLRWLIDFFIDKAPKPLKFVMFLLMLLVFGNLITYFLHIGGIHCNSNREVISTSFLDVTGNLGILLASNEKVIKGSVLNISEVYSDVLPQDCYFYARKLDTGYYEECNITNSTEDCKYYLKDGSYGGCHDCISDEICFQAERVFGMCGWHQVCLDDAFYSEGFKLNCGDSCYVPKNYMFNSSSGTFDCINQTLCGENATSVNTEVDEKIDKAGGTLLYGDVEEGDYKSVVKMECNSNLNPRITMLGIDIFDYTIWLLLGIISVLFIMFHKLTSMN